MRILISLLFVVFSTNVYGQTKVVEIDSLVNQVRATQALNLIDYRDLRYLDSDVLIESLQYHFINNSQDEKVSFLCIYYLGEIGAYSNDITVKQKVVSLLIEGLKSDFLLVWQSCGRGLLKYPSNCYTLESKRELKNLSVHKNNLEYWHILLLGVAKINDNETINWLKQVSDKRDYGLESEGWAAKLALARLGYSEQINQVISIVESAKEPIMKSIMIKYYGFIRQKETTEKLIEYLDSDIQLPSVKGWDEGIFLKCYALEILSAIIIDFPVPRKSPSGFSESEISITKNWFKVNRNYKILK